MGAKEGALLSTLGTEPQVVTLSLHALLSWNEPIRKAIALHSRGNKPEIIAAVRNLRERWDELPFASAVELELVEVPIQDLDSELALQVAYRTIRDVISRLKARGLRIHLNISGGRKPLALCALIAAQFLFDAEDRLWYLVSSPELVESRRLCPEPGDRWKLISLPVPLWTDSSSLVAAMAEYDDPWALARLQRELLHREERARWSHFLGHVLTPAEREVVQELILRGGTDVEIAGQLAEEPAHGGAPTGQRLPQAAGVLGLAGGASNRPHRLGRASRPLR
jgi:CRISPR-associated protein Csx14